MTDYCLHNIYDCTEAYNTNYDSEYVSTVFIEQTSKHWTENALDISLGLLGTTLILQFGLVFYSIYKSFKSHIKPRSKLDVPADKKIKITQIKSAIGYRQRTKDTLKALGIRKLNGSVLKKNTLAIQGMITAINHLLKVEEV